MEALSSSNELFNFVIYETISATPSSQSLSPNNNTTTTFLLNNYNKNDNDVNHHDQLFLDRLFQSDGRDSSAMIAKHEEDETRSVGPTVSSAVSNCSKKKKRKRKARVCKNKEEAETQRMTHIAVERNRRKQMNEHLAVLRSIMPESYVQRGDQASIVGGAIEFVKQLEHLLQSLEAQKLQSNLLGTSTNNINNSNDSTSSNNNDNQDPAILESSKFLEQPFSKFFAYPQYTWSQASNKYTSSKSKASMADIEVTLIETHANLRILSRRSLRQLSKLVTGFQTLRLTVLHLNVTTMSPLVLYSVSVKVEEECLLTSVDDIASAVHHMLGIIEEEAVSNLCVEYDKLN